MTFFLGQFTLKELEDAFAQNPSPEAKELLRHYYIAHELYPIALELGLSFDDTYELITKEIFTETPDEEESNDE